LTRLQGAPYAHVASIGKRLTQSLDFDATLQHVARLPVPGLADWCLAYTPGDGDVRMPRVAVAHASPPKEALLRSVWQRHPVMLPYQHPVQVSLRSREPLLQPTCSPADVVALGLSDTDTEVLRAIGLQSLMVMPMVAHGLVVGALMLAGANRQRREFDPDTLESASAVARWSAQAIYNAQLFWEARLAAHMRDEVLSAASQDLMQLVSRIQQRVSHVRYHVSSTDVPSAEAVHSGMTEIDDLASAITQRLRDLTSLAGASRRV